MSAQARLVSSPPPARRRTAFWTAATSVVLVVVAALSGQGSSLQHNPGPADTSGSPALTDQEYAFARNVVRHEIRRIDAVLTSATVTVSYGTVTDPNIDQLIGESHHVTVGYGRVTDSNVGYPCMSGRLLNIKLIGDFPHIVVSPMAALLGTTPPDATVHADVLTADAKTGRVCQIGVQTGKVAPDPGAESLPFDWLGFLGTARLQ